MTSSRRCFRSTLRGIALGDALGLPHERLGPERIARRLGVRAPGPALLPGLMMVSDDTDHACMAFGAWRDCGGSPEAFSRILAARFRWWFAALPPGVGLATGRSAIKLWLGFGHKRSGVRSAGNGPLMRSAILGVVLRDADAMREEIVLRSTRLTHTDARALDAALVLAHACASLARDGRPASCAAWCRSLAAMSRTDTLRSLLLKLAEGPREAEGLNEFLQVRVLGAVGRCPAHGVSGYAPESLVGALAAFLYGGPDALAVIGTAIRLGGDTDSVASFAGALAGAADPLAFETCEARALGRRLADLPWNFTTLDALADGARPAWWRLALRPARNLLQLIIVIGHGLLRPAGL